MIIEVVNLVIRDGLRRKQPDDIHSCWGQQKRLARVRIRQGADERMRAANGQAE